MKCAHCGSELAGNDQFCGECGTPRPRPVKRARRSWSRAVVIGGVLLVALAVVLIGLRRLIPPSQLGLSGGQSIPSATLPPTATPRPTQSPALAAPTLAPPTATANAPLAEVDPELTPVPANGRIVFKDTVIGFTLPADWSYKPLGEMLWLKPPAVISERALLTVDHFQPVSGSSSAADELRHWLTIHDDITWTPLITEKTAVGELVWSTGQSTTAMPIYAAIQGPLKNGQILYWWGQAPDRQWAAMLPLFQQISRSTTDAQP